MQKLQSKKLENFKEGDFLYIMKVNEDPMRILDCIVKKINITPTGVSANYCGKLKILLPDGTFRWFYTQLYNIDLGKYNIYSNEYNSLNEDTKEEYFISIDRNYLIDEYIRNSNQAILLWEDNIKKYQELINSEKSRIQYIEKQRYDNN